MNAFTKKHKHTFTNFVFFSAGPVGDHALLIDYANRFFESTGTPSFILMKHPSAFLKDMSLPYRDHIRYLEANGSRGMLRMVVLALRSMFERNCFVLVLPIPPPRYLKLFAYYIRFCTRSRIVALESECGFSLPGGPVSSADFVGKQNSIPAHVDTELYYEEANRLLSFLGHKPINRVPTLQHVEHPEVFHRYGLRRGNYIAMHLCASSADKSLPPDRWNYIIQKLMEYLPEARFVMTGAKGDVAFIEESLSLLPRERVVLAISVSLQELLTIYTYARTNITVHTGNAHLINMLHAPAVTVNFKGVHMFRFSYNPHGIELYSTEGCTCHPLERKCSLVEYRGKGYMACLFNLKDEDIIRAILKIYNGKSDSHTQQ